LFWELSLIPAFFLIKLWGGEGAAQRPRSSSSTPWSVRGIAAGFLALFVATGSMDFEVLAQMARPANWHCDSGASRPDHAVARASACCSALPSKSRSCPFHTWLPATYSEAPTPVTMLLTGAMSKMGVYGLLRMALPIFGHATCADAHAAAGAGNATVVAWAHGPRRCRKI
jgi:NADH-quinone oxidoreductase subunit M